MAFLRLRPHALRTPLLLSASSNSGNPLLLLSASARKQSPPVLTVKQDPSDEKNPPVPTVKQDPSDVNFNRLFSSAARNYLLLLSASARKQSPRVLSSASAAGAVQQIGRQMSSSDGKPSNTLLSAGSLVFNYPIVSLQAVGVRGFAGRPGGYPSDGAFMCFACYNEKKRSVVFDSPEALKKHYKANHSEIPGPPCRCGASFPAEENKHGCVLRENETLKKFRERMRRDMRRYEKKIYKCPVTNCQELCPSPLALHLHHLQRH